MESSEQRLVEFTESGTHLQLEVTELKTLISQRETTLADLSSKMEGLHGDLDDKVQQLKDKEIEINILQVKFDQLQVLYVIQYYNVSRFLWLFVRE